MLMIAGSAASYAKSVQMTLKAKQRIYDPNNFQVKSGNESVSAGDLKAMADQQKVSSVESVAAKLRMGQELSDEDLELLRKENPQLYQEAMKTVYERRAYEKRMSQCQTKDEVERVKLQRLQGFASEVQSIQQSSMSLGAKEKAIGFVGMRMAGVNDEHAKFIKSVRYAKLPWERDLEEKKKAEKKGAAEGERQQEAKPVMPERDPELQRKIDEITRKAEEEHQEDLDADAAKLEKPQAVDRPKASGSAESAQEPPKVHAVSAPSPAPTPVTAAAPAPTGRAAPAPTPAAPTVQVASPAQAAPAPVKLSVKA